MKKDFSQPFELSPTVDVSLYIKLDDDTYIIEKNNYNEYHLYGFKAAADKLVAQQITKYLYENGLALQRLRLLTSEDAVSFSFTDNTPGLIEPTHVYLAHVERVSDQSGLNAVTYNDLRENIMTSSFVEDNERDAFNFV